MHTLASPIRRALAVAPHNEAVVCGDVRLTYTQWWERWQALSRALRGAGLARGDRVAVVAPNCHRYLELYFAVPAAGLVLVPLNARHTDAELEYALNDSGARLLFTHRESAALTGAVERVVSLPDDYESFLDGVPDDPADPWPAPAEDDLAGLFYTGGTTGAAKGVMLTHRNLVANTYHYLSCAEFSPDTRWLVMAPLFHAAGSIAAMATVWAAGTHVVLPAFEPAAALDLIEGERVTATLGVPTMLAALAEEQERKARDVTSLVHLSHGGSPISSDVLRRAMAAFPGADFLHIYGATETAPIVTLLPHEQHLVDRPEIRSCGRPAIGVEVMIAGPGGQPQPRGEPGELLVRGPNVMTGYWNKPAESTDALIDGWYRTGDVGYQDERGHVFLVDRSKDMIVTGGENVYSTEVEEVLFRHPAVREVAVFGVPDDRWGEAVIAVVHLRSPVDTDELLEHCRRSIAAYKVPKRIEVSAEPLPKSAVGKVLKRELREPYWVGRERRVGG